MDLARTTFALKKVGPQGSLFFFHLIGSGAGLIVLVSNNVTEYVLACFEGL